MFKSIIPFSVLTKEHFIQRSLMTVLNFSNQTCSLLRVGNRSTKN